MSAETLIFAIYIKENSPRVLLFLLPSPKRAKRGLEGKKFALNLPVQVQALKFPSLGLENQALALENESRGWKTQAPGLSLLSKAQLLPHVKYVNSALLTHSENQDNFPVAKGFGPPQVPQEKRRNTPEKHTRPAARVHCPPPRP